MTFNIDQIRNKYKPDCIRILFVGESAPAGGTFFYNANSQAYHTIRSFFGKDNDTCFLTWFKDQGFYLDDLVQRPINDTAQHERTAAWKAGIPDLAARIRSYHPQMVIAIVLKIRADVAEAARLSGTGATFHAVPFPGNGHQLKFKEAMSRILPYLPIQGHRQNRPA